MINAAATFVTVIMVKLFTTQTNSVHSNSPARILREFSPSPYKCRHHPCTQQHPVVTMFATPQPHTPSPTLPPKLTPPRSGVLHVLRTNDSRTDER